MPHHDNHGFLTDSKMDSRLWWSFALNVLITAGEVAGGLFSGSLALLSDALHNLSDVASVAITIAARRWGRKAPDSRHTYGMKRIEVMAAAFNAFLLLAVTVFISREALYRILHPKPVRADVMFWVALFAFVANGVSVLLIWKHERSDLNVRSTFLHLLQDTMLSLVVVGVALFAGTKVGPYLDPIASLVIGFAVTWVAFSILIDVFSIVSESVPRGMHVEKIVSDIDSTFPPVRLHHVHLWEVGPGDRMLTAHLSTGEMNLHDSEELVAKVRARLLRKWEIGHVTLETESGACRNPGDFDLTGNSEDPQEDDHG